LYQGVVGEVIGGTLQGLGSFGMLADSEENFLYELGEALREHTMDATPIFEREPGQAFAFNDVGWWAKNMPSLLSTLSMFIPGAAVGKGAAMAGRAFAASGRAGRVLKGVDAARKADSTIDKTKAASALAGKEAAIAGRIESQAQTIGTALGMRHAENIREAMDIQQQATTDFIESDMSVEAMKGTEAYRAWKAENGDRTPTRYELAKYIGGAAAKRAYAVNSVNLVFDLAQSAMIFKPFKLKTRGAKATTAEAAEAAKKLGKDVVKERTGTRLSRFIDRYGEFTGGMASEGVEEAINFIGSGEGAAYAEQLRGMKSSTFSERLSEYLNDDHLWESAFFGALGGGVFQAVGGAFGKKQNALLKSYEDRIKTQEYFATEIKKAEEAGDAKKAAELKNQMITNLAMQAAQQGRVDQLITQLEDDAYLEGLSKSGLGSMEDLLAQREKIIETVLAAEKHYQEAHTWAMENGMDAFARGEYLKDSIQEQNTLDIINKELEALNNEGNVQEDEVSIMAAKRRLLDELKKELENNPEAKKQFQGVFIKLQNEVLKYEEKNGKIDTSAANEATYKNQQLAALQQVTKDRIANMKSDASIVEYMEKGEAAAKEAREKAEQNILKEISEMDDVAQLEDVIKAAKRNKDDKFKKAAEARLAELQKQEDTDKKVEDDTVNEEETEEETPEETPEGTQGEFAFPEDEDTEDVPGPEEGEEDTFGPTREERTFEPLEALIERITEEGEAARDQLVEEIDQERKELNAQLNSLRKKLKTAVKNEQPTGTLKADIEVLTRERDLMTAYKKALRKLKFDEAGTTIPSGSPRSTELSPEMVLQLQAQLDASRGAPVFLLGLIQGFMPAMVAGTDMFGLNMSEWRLNPNAENVKDGKLILTGEQADQYLALQSILKGNGKLVIVETTEEFETESSDEEGIFTEKEVDNVTEVGREKSAGNIRYVAKRTGKERHYAIEVDTGIKRVRIGYLPQTTTLAKHARMMQTLSTKPLERQAGLKLLESDQFPLVNMQMMYAMMHASGFNAVQALDQLTRLRQTLDARDGSPLEVKLHTPKKEDGSPAPVQRGSLLRPAPGSSLKLSDLGIESLIEEHGIAVMVTNDKGTYLHNLKTGRKMRQQPYQDGRVALDDTGRKRDFGNGAFFVPIQASSDPNDIIYVRINDVTLGQLEGPAVNDAIDALGDTDLNQRAEKLREVMPVHIVDNGAVVDSNQLKAERIKLKNGAVVAPDRTFFIKNGQVIGSHNTKNGRITAPNKNVKSAKELVEQMPFRATVRNESINYTLDNEAIASMIQQVPSPVTPILDSNNQFLGYRHPITSLEQPDRKLIFPDTRNTEVSVQIDLGSVADPDVEVVVPDAPKDKKTEDKKEGVRKTNGRSPFLTVERAAESKLDRRATDTEQKQAENWLSKNLPHVPFRRVKGMIVRGGTTAYGIWEQGMVKVSDMAVVGTEFHEAFHAVMDAYLPASRRDKILAEAKKKYGDLSAIELEEKLAEAFREYMLSDGASMSEKSGIRRFFAELLELVNAFFNGEFKARRLMQQINKGKFAYKPDARTENFVTKFMSVPSFSAVELKELSKVMPLALDETLETVNAYIAAKIDSQKKATEYLDQYYDKPEQQELKEKVQEIGDAIMQRRQEQPETDGESKPLGKKEIAKLVLEAALAEDGGLETLFFFASIQATPEMQEKMNADIDRIRLNRDALVRDMLQRNELVDALIGALEADVVTGSTDTQQYGNKSMQEVNPKEKIPASVRNLIARTMAMPTVLSEAVTEAMEKNDPNLLKAAVLKHSSNNKFNQFSQFGLPMMLDFNQVYPYLLHHLSDATSYEDMKQRLEKLGRNGNPDMILLLAKLEDDRTPDLLRKQFYVAFKRAKSDELNVTVSSKRGEDQRTPIRESSTDSARPMPADANLATHNRQVIKTKMGGMTEAQQDKVVSDLRKWSDDHDYTVAFDDRKQLLELLSAAGFSTRTPGAINVAVMKLPASELAELATNVADAIESLQVNDPKRALQYLKSASQSVLPADYLSVTLGFKNGENTSVYSHMLPCYLTEELDRLKNKAYRNRVLSEDVRLKDSSWLKMLDGTNVHPMYIRFGHYNGKPYTKLSTQERMVYDLEIMFGRTFFKNVANRVSYVPIPVPSDADNSMLVRSVWFNMTQAQKDRALQRILDNDKSPQYEGKTVEDLKKQFASEGNEFMIRGGQKVQKALQAIADRKNANKKNESEKVTPEQIAAEFMAAQFESNWNAAHWIGGAVQEFDNESTVQMQKRFKQVLSPGTPSALSGENFKSITFVDPIKSYPEGDPRREKFGDIERADAQTYVTLDHYRNVMKAHGKLTPAMDAAITKAQNRQPLNRGERALLRPYKPFYYGRVNQNGERVGVQIKNSLFPLIPLDTEGTELDNLRKFMEDNTIAQAQPKTAQKVGRPENLAVLWTSDNKWAQPENWQQSVQELPMDHYRQQVQINDHMMHEDTIGWGTQISKIIMGGLAGTKEVEQLLHKENELIKNQKKAILNKYFDKNGPNEQALRKLLQDEMGNSASRAFREFLEDVEHGRDALSNPHFRGQVAQQLITIFQKKHKHLQVPGGTQVQVSDLGRDNGIDGDLKGMRVENGKVLPAQVITSRNFLPKKYRNMSIEEIRKVDPEALQMIVYRIPGEGKNSMAVVEVVQFLEPGQDGMIVPADFVAQMGSDFDVDKLFINWKSTRSGKNAEIWNEYFDIMKGILMTPEVFTEEVQHKQGFDTLEKIASDLKATAPSRQMQIMDGSIDGYLANNPYSGLSQLQMWEDNMAGISLKGIAAKANTFWLNVERFGFNIKFETELEGISELDPSKVTLETRRLTAEGVAAAMDGAKNPVYGYLGLNEKNWEIFHDLYMLGMDEKRAIEIASNPAVLARLNFNEEYEALDPEQKKRDESALAVFDAYQDEWGPTLAPLKKLARVAESKLIDMASQINPVMLGGLLSDRLDSIGHNQGAEKTPSEVPVLSAHLELTETVQQIMESIGVDFFSIRDAGGLEFGAWLRGQSLMAAEYFLGDRKNQYVRMGKLTVEEKTRKAAVPGDYSNWNMGDFFSFFTTTEGQEILANDPDLARVMSHLMQSDDYTKLNTQFRPESFINVRITGLTDPEVAEDFTDAWDALYNDDKHPIAAALSDALVEYEAERSGWRYGTDTLTQHMPYRVAKTIESPNRDQFGNIARVVEALNPNIPVVLSVKDALKGTRPKRYESRVYISRYNAAEGRMERGFVTVTGTGKGFKGTKSINELNAELSGTIEEIKADMRKKFKTSEQRSAQGVESNFSTRKAHLEGVFASAGIHITVERDSSLTGAGEVKWDGERGVIKVNPDRMGGDTVIHEFAHVYVELLGYEHPLVQQAIKELRGTALYSEIEAMYPDLSRRDLELEVLVTAMGRKGDTIFESTKEQSRFRTIVNRIIRAIGKVLGVQQDTAQLLAENMIQGVNLKAHDVQQFKAEQRISKRVNETRLQEEVLRELGERTREMRELGMTSAEETQLMNEIVEGRRNLAGKNPESDKAGVLESLTDFADTVLQRTNAFLDQGTELLNSTRNVAEFTEGDRQMFNQMRQLGQTLSTLDQAVNNFEETMPGESVTQFKELKDRIPQVLRNLRELERNAVSNKLKAQSANMEIREIEANLFDLAGNVELSKYMQDSSAATQLLQGLGEQGPVVLQLLKKQIDRVVEGTAMEARNAKSEVDAILDELGDTPIESLLDGTGKAFVSPISDTYWSKRAEAQTAGVDMRLWDAENNHMPYTAEYYQWLYSAENQEIKILRGKLNRLEEIKAKRGLTEEEKGQEQVWKRDLEDLRVHNNQWNKFNEHDVDVEGYRAARAKAQKEGRLEEFDKEHPFVTRFSKPYPALGNPYHKGFKVRDKYKNPDWKEGDTERPLSKYDNPEYENLTDKQRKAIEGLQSIMGRYLPKDSSFMQQNLIPQTLEPKSKGFKETLNDFVKIEGEEQKARLDADGRFVPVRRQLAILRRRKADENVSTNLRESMYEFIDQVSAEQAKNTLTAVMLATRDQLADSELLARKGIDITGSGKQTTTGPAMTRGERSNAIKVLDHVLEGYLGRGWTDQSKHDKTVKRFLKYTSFMGIGLNPSAWVNNVLYGSLQQRLETMGGAQWTRKQMREARKQVNMGILDLARARKKGSNPTSKVAALISFFDVTMDQRELPDGVDTLGKLFDKAYAGQTYGELVMQSQVMLAMLKNTKVILADGTETDLETALEWTGGKNLNIPKGAKIVKADGLEVPLTLQELGVVKSKARGILQRIHGAYNSEDIGMWHRKTIGQVVYQFRKWVPQAVKRRFGKDSFNEIREEQEIGYYNALFKDVIFGAYKDGKLFRLLTYYNEMSDKPHIQTAARKAMIELSAAAALGAMATLLGALVEIDPDDDDEFILLNDEFYKAKLLYHTDRLFMEMAQYTPPGIFDFATKLGKDPAAAWRTSMLMLKIAQEATYTAFRFEFREFEGGRNYGDYRLPIYLSRLLPFWKQIQRTRDTVNSYEAYKLVSYN
jgi:hypothetical protein